MNKKGKAAFIGSEEEENLAIRYLAAVLDEHGHKVKIVPCSQYSDFPKVLKDFKSFDPDLLGVSIAFQSLATIFFEIIRKLKEMKPQVHVTVGGHFPTFEYIKILETQDAIDSVIRFEGEKSILMLLNSILDHKNFSKIPNLVYRTRDHDRAYIKENRCVHEFPDLDGLPFPLRDKKPRVRLGERFATLVAGRGCFHSACLYCCIGAFHSKKHGNKYAVRSPGNVAKEMGELYHAKKVRLFQFHDDNFMLPDKKYSLERLKSLKEALRSEKIETEKIALLIKTRPDSLNRDIASILGELGTAGIFLGVENASQSGLKALGRGSTIENIEDSLKLLEIQKIAVTFNLLIFHPKATLGEINENIYFMKKNKKYAFDFGRAEIVSGSPLERLVLHKGLLMGHWPHWDYKIEDDSVEKMFRIKALTFHGKGSPYPGLSHLIIALSYRSQLINKFYSGKLSKRLSKYTRDLIIRFNEFTLENLIHIYKLTVDLESMEEIDTFYKELEDTCRIFISEAEDISSKMWKLQILEGKFRNLGLKDYFQNSNLFHRFFKI